MTDQPAGPNGQAKKPEAPKPETKVFDFSEEDQGFLQPRQVLINQYRLVIGDLDYAMQEYILANVVKRLSIDPKLWAISYDVANNKLTITKKPPQIITPPVGIVIPKK